MGLRFWLLIALCSILPDVDIIGYYVGVKYGDVLGHRGFFHSLTFAAVVSVLVVILAFPAASRFSKKWWSMLVFFFFVIASHGFLDSMTERGLGVAFFSPFDTTRYFMFWRPVYASPMRIEQFFSHSGIEVLFGEIIWIWLPMIALHTIFKFLRKRRKTE